MNPDAEPRLDIDTTVSHSARIWNYLLGGKDHYAVDREVGEQIRAVMPRISELVRGCWEFMARGVHFMAQDAGIHQFLEVGSGLPTDPNTHKVALAARAARAAENSGTDDGAADDAKPELLRVVYVDTDPLVLSHARALLGSTPDCLTDHVDADVRDPDAVLRAASGILDLSQPVGLCLKGVLTLITDDEEANAVVGRLLDALPSGSYLSAFNTVFDGRAMRRTHDLWNAKGSSPAALRSPESVARFFSGVDLVEPGLVSVSRWRPDPETFPPGTPPPPEVPALGGVGRKP